MHNVEKLFEVSKNFHPQSKVWIYQADREFTTDEIQLIQEKVSEYANQWQVHGSFAKAVGQVLFARFILFLVDDSTPASGCSIDSSVEFIKKLGQELNIDFFNRLNIAYIHPETEKIETTTLSKLRDTLAKGDLPSFTIIFNNTITTLDQLDGKWMIPVRNSWLYKR